MALAVAIRTVATTSRTSIGTQDFTSPGLGTCVGYIVIVAGTEDLGSTTFRAGASASWGCSDGTRSRVAGVFDRDNVATTVARSWGRTDSVIDIKNPANGGIIQRAVHDSFITDGVRLNYTNNNGSAALQMIVILFGGSDVECFAFNASGTNPATKVTTSFLTDFVFTNVMRTTDGSQTGEMWFDPGIATRTNPVEGNMCTRTVADHGVSTSETKRGKYSERLSQSIILQPGADVQTGTTIIEDYVSDGFDVQGILSGTPVNTGPRICGLAVKVGSSVRWKAEVNDTTATSTGIQNKTTPGWRAGMVYMAFTANNANNSLKSGAAGGCGASDFENQRAISLMMRNNVATTDTATTMADAIVNCHNHTRAVHLYNASTAEKLSTGYELDWDVIAGTVRRLAILVVEELPFEGTSALSMPSMQLAATGEQVFRGSGDLPLAAMQAAAAGRLVHSGTAAPAMSAMQAAAAGRQVFQGTSAVSLPAVQIQATGQWLYEGTAAVSLPAFQAAAAGRLIFQGTGAPAMPALELTAVGRFTGFLQCDVDLTASYDGEVALAAAYDGEVALAGTFDEEVVLAGSFDEEIALAGSFDEEDPLAAGFGQEKALAAAFDQDEVDLTASYDGVAELTASFDQEKALAAAFDVVGEHEAGYNGEADHTGSIC